MDNFLCPVFVGFCRVSLLGPCPPVPTRRSSTLYPQMWVLSIQSPVIPTRVLTSELRFDADHIYKMFLKISTICRFKKTREWKIFHVQLLLTFKSLSWTQLSKSKYILTIINVNCILHCVLLVCFIMIEKLVVTELQYKFFKN